MTEKTQYETRLPRVGPGTPRRPGPRAGCSVRSRSYLDDGRAIRPFAVAPWADNPTEDWEASAPPLLKRLRGDWVCLPFGLPGEAADDLDADWLEGLDANLESPDPGAARRLLQCELAPREGRAACADDELRPPTEVPDFPDRAPHLGGRRRSAIHVETRIAARAACELQWGCHPTFRLPEEPGAFEIGFGGNVTAFTYPGFFEAGVSRVAHGRTCAGIDAVPMLDGSTSRSRRCRCPSTPRSFFWWRGTMAWRG